MVKLSTGRLPRVTAVYVHYCDKQGCKKQFINTAAEFELKVASELNVLSTTRNVIDFKSAF